MVLTVDFCTQYGMAAAIPAGPLVMLAGLFVIAALTYAGLREVAWPAFLVTGISATLLGLLWVFGRIASRDLRSGHFMGLGVLLFAGLLFVMNALTTLAFCGSMSV